MKKYLKQITRVSLLLAILGASMAFADSPVWGTYKVECPANSDTYIGITTTRAPVFTGKVQAIQSGTTNIVAQGEPNWSVNQFVYVAGSQTNHYYLKFTSGELEGAWYDIKSNSSSDVEIEIGSAELAKIAVDDTFQIIPHWTLSTLFPNGGGFTASSDITTSSILWKYTSWTSENGVELPKGTENQFLKSYYFRKKGTKAAWSTVAGNIVNDDVVEPMAFFRVSQSSTGCTTVYNGVIPMSATSTEVFVSADSNQDIYFTVPSAVDMKVSDFTESLIDSGIFKSSETSAQIDQLMIYGNGSVSKDPPADLLCFHRVKGTKSMWCSSSGANVGENLLKAGSAVIFRKLSTGEDYVARIVFKPSYINIKE